MEVTQISGLLNSVFKEVVGLSDLSVASDLSNIVDIGGAIENKGGLDNYVKSLIDKIGKTYFVDRPYSGKAPNIFMDSWEYGSIMEKIDADIPESEDDDAWELVAGQTYNQDMFVAPSASQRFWNNKSAKRINMSFADRQLHESFFSAGQQNAFLSMLEQRITTRGTIDRDNLSKAIVANMIGATISDGSANRAINVLALYNAANGTTLTYPACLYDLDFMKYMLSVIMITTDHMTEASTLFNIGGKVRYTPKDRQKLIMLSDVYTFAGIYLQSDTFHNEFVKYPSAETINFWQGTSTDYSLDSISTINITANLADGTTAAVNQSGIVACLFDRYACGICNEHPRVTTHYNARGEFYNNWYKYDAMTFNDFNENCVVFYCA